MGGGGEGGCCPVEPCDIHRVGHCYLVEHYYLVEPGGACRGCSCGEGGEERGGMVHVVVVVEDSYGSLRAALYKESL